jgi:hypothetical protein
MSDLETPRSRDIAELAITLFTLVAGAMASGAIWLPLTRTISGVSGDDKRRRIRFCYYEPDSECPPGFGRCDNFLSESNEIPYRNLDRRPEGQENVDLF